MELTLLLTARCNASCRHCSTDCGPHRTEGLSRETIFRLMDQAAALSEGEPPSFYLTGGEVFLDFPLLLDVIRHGKGHGAVVTCVTNGYWAASAEKARTVLTAVKAAGLSELAVSSSRFHEEFVSRRRVERVLAAAREVGLRCSVKNVHSRSDRAARGEVSAWARAAGAAGVQEIPLQPHLRAGQRLPRTEYESLRGLPEGVCPARLMSVAEDGRTYMCCEPGSFTPLLALGSAHEMPLKDLRDRFYLGGTQRLLRQHGPIHFARAAQARGLEASLRPSYAGICDLCTHIATDPALAAVATDVSNEFEFRQLEQVLGSMVEKNPAPRADADADNPTSTGSPLS